ncbi:MAG: GTP-binding protein [Euryarchaeota archaeon]|nr:GTP-binding protein [Euryarchaeota archaeon]
MLGDPAVGKTSLVRRFVNDMFDDKYLETVGAKPTKKVLQVKGNRLTMMVWDIAGHSYSLHPNYYSGAKGALMVCDLTRRSTLQSLDTWQSALKNKSGDVPVKVLANKSDIFDWNFEPEELGEKGFDWLKTSAKTGEKVEEAFQKLAEEMLDA